MPSFLCKHRNREDPTCYVVPGTRGRSPTYLHTSSSTPSIQSVQYTRFEQVHHMPHPAALARDDVLLLPRPTLLPDAYPRLIVRNPRSLRLPTPFGFRGFPSRLAVSVAGVDTVSDAPEPIPRPPTAQRASMIDLILQSQTRPKMGMLTRTFRTGYRSG